MLFYAKTSQVLKAFILLFTYLTICSNSYFWHTLNQTLKIMKQRTLLVALVFLIASAFVQTAPQIPDFKNSPMAINEDGTLKKLEKQNAELKTKAKGMGYGGVSTFINIDGKNSPVRVKATTDFILKVDADVDPETVFYVSPAKEVGKTREIEMTRVSAFAAYGAKTKSVKKDDIPLEFVKIQDGVYRIKCTGLTPGTEYAFVNATQGASGSSSTVFCFGVD